MACIIGHDPGRLSRLYRFPPNHAFAKLSSINYKNNNLKIANNQSKFILILIPRS
jgi:hypothetical protein